MDSDYTYLEAHDCLPFKNSKDYALVLQKFLALNKNNIFSINQNLRDESNIIEFDYRRGEWVASRFIGEAILDFNGINYKLIIRPRFGESVLFRMLEEILNIKVMPSKNEVSTSTNWNYLIKKIISFIWLQKLSNANQHGLPKGQIQRQHEGQLIKGTLNVRRSFKHYYIKKQVVSVSREKSIDQTISQILFQAHKIISQDFLLSSNSVPDFAKEAMNEINMFVRFARPISQKEYLGIVYKEIYKSWKPIVDFSWNIINESNFNINHSGSKNGIGLFLDMAEIWEIYLRSILKKKLSPLGWALHNSEIRVYKDNFFKRILIPDLVFERDNQIIVWDAKYKRMLGRSIDVDRTDFFQIHTYIQHFLKDKNVKLGGLLYPLSKSVDFNNSFSPFLMHERGHNTAFHVDGIEMNENSEIVIEDLIKNEEEFFNRILMII